MSSWSVELSLPANAAPLGELTQRQIVLDLYDQVRPLLLAHLKSLGLTPEDAEDVTNESFMRLITHLVEARRNENLRGWLFRVAYNLSMDVHRANKRYSYGSSSETEDALLDIYEAVDPYPSPEVELIEKQSFRNLRSAVSQLTLQQRKCLLLRAEGLRYREIASTLGISLQRAAALLERGTTRLRATL
jgi:RNA polymerase sigma-70 factor (ECF subfamily)